MLMKVLHVQENLRDRLHLFPILRVKVHVTQNLRGKIQLFLLIIGENLIQELKCIFKKI